MVTSKRLEIRVAVGWQTRRNWTESQDHRATARTGTAPKCPRTCETPEDRRKKAAGGAQGRGGGRSGPAPVNLCRKRVGAIEQRGNPLAGELAQLTRMTRATCIWRKRQLRGEPRTRARPQRGGGHRRTGAPVGRALAEARLRAGATELESRLRTHFVAGPRSAGRVTSGAGTERRGQDCGPYLDVRFLS